MGMHTGYKERCSFRGVQIDLKRKRKWEWGTKEVLGKAEGD